MKRISRVICGLAVIGSLAACDSSLFEPPELLDVEGKELTGVDGEQIGTGEQGEGGSGSGGSNDKERDRGRKSQ